MRSVRLLLYVLAALPLALGATATAGERLTKRSPGTIRIRGDPDRVAEYDMVVAFPRLRFRRPLYVGAPPDGTNRIFVLEQDGRVIWFPNERNTGDAKVALDISEKTYRRHNEEGLLGLAFHPQFEKNKTLYLHYSANRPRRGVVAKFKTNSARTKILPRSERVVLEQRQPWGNHNGGGLEFGPDGYLYITFGDGGAANDPLGSGQNLSTWLGSLLRIDIDKGKPYAIPKDNPFVKVRKARPEIYAYGLRNVWRFSFDRVTGDLWGGDVGQNAWEEVDIIVKGGNYGWNVREGHHPFRGGAKRPGMLDPVISHDTRAARSVTGGYVYRGRKLPGLVGAYVYADYATGNVWALRWDGKKVTQLKLLGRKPGIASFGEDEAGEIYMAVFDGFIYKLRRSDRRVAEREFPRKLSETGLFTDVRRMTPHPALIPYEVNVPLWSDGGLKERYVMLPDLEKIRVAQDGSFLFPRGTIFVKTFLAGARRLETRLLLHRNNGWAGFTYVWDEQQQDAWLIDARVEKDLPQDVARRTSIPHWTFPGRSDCTSCHTPQAGHVLGFRSEQLDRTVDYGGTPENQLDAFRRIGLFEGEPRRRPAWPGWDDLKGGASNAQVRAYLDVNCANCHRPNGTGNAKIDLRYETPLDRAHLLNESPGQGDLGISGARIVVPGRPSKSLLYVRMTRTDEKGMPNLAHNQSDREALKRVAQWIKGLK